MPPNTVLSHSTEDSAPPSITVHTEPYVDLPLLTELLVHRPVGLVKEYWGRRADTHSDYSPLIDVEEGVEAAEDRPQQPSDRCYASALKHALEAVGFATFKCFEVVSFIVKTSLMLALVSFPKALQGLAWMFVGNIILRETHLPGYVDSNKIAAIASVGGIFAIVGVATVLKTIGVLKTNFEYAPYDGEPDYPWSVKGPATVCSGALVGPIGGSVLRMLSVDLQGFDGLKSSWGGALGAMVCISMYYTLEPALPRPPVSKIHFSITRDPNSDL